MNSIEKLKSMVNKPFLYNNEEVVIIGYCDNTGDDGDQLEIYLNTGKVIELKMYDLLLKLEKFKPLTNTVIVLANERLNKVSSMNPSILSDLRDVILEQIKEVKNNPAAVPQAKQIFQGVNSLVGLAKMEIEYRRFLEGAKGE